MLSRRISGAKLRRVREERCLTVAAIAAAAGCSASNIYKIEQNKAQPSPQVYVAIKAALAVDDEALIADSAQPESVPAVSAA
ncbi:helix-turn-helix transcriptional regulator [Streptomyces sp. NPDC006132]|uniref:helix-turn-helix domain-containing protein n=1 Tax=Streptomyces sp. NPDC006132 TaxID=3156732 RepID=UPI0033DB5FA4